MGTLRSAQHIARDIGHSEHRVNRVITKLQLEPVTYIGANRAFDDEQAEKIKEACDAMLEKPKVRPPVTDTPKQL